MKKVVLFPVYISLVLISALMLSSCEKSSSNPTIVDGTLKTDSTFQSCESGLTFMREEEKLAHDVYVQLFEIYHLPVFNNISRSEEVHTNAIKGLLEYYQLADPYQEGLGVFSNEELTSLYNELMTQGQTSVEAALTVGATIEEVDIADLTDAISNCTEDTIITVYNRLRNASGNHLRAFVGQLRVRGVNYVPQILSQEWFDEIMSGHHETGGGGCDTVATTINETEAEDLMFMREEEKLAHDVYVAMFAEWNYPVFDHISKSEQQHTSQILRLINLFHLEDPALAEEGVFSNQDLQNLYDLLITQGNQSGLDALKVGATIEEVDIIDLWERVQHTTNPTIVRTYNNLEKASEAHLRAFVRVMASLGFNYEPQYLSIEEYTRIING